MKRFICIAISLLLAFSAAAEITVNEGEYEAAGRLAAAENGAACGYYCSLNFDVYYIKEGTVCVTDGRSGVTSVIAELPADACYPSIAADSDGNVYVLKADADETVKPSVILLTKNGQNFYALEYAYPGAGMHIAPEAMLFSDEGMCGVIYTKLTAGGKTARLMSTVNVMWGSLTGFDEFVFVDTSKDTVYVVPASGCFDPYGYANEACEKLISDVLEGSLCVPESVSLSQDGQSLLMKADGIVYVMDTVTLELERIDIENGTIGWSGNDLFAWDDDGNGISVGRNAEFGTDSDWGSSDREFGISDEFGRDWGTGSWSDLDDWA